MSFGKTSALGFALLISVVSTQAYAGHIRCETYLRDRLPMTTSVAEYKETVSDPVLSRLALSDAYKWERAEAALGRKFTDAERIAMTAVYDSAVGRVAKNRLPTGEYYGEARYTKKQLETKRAILREAGFSDADIAALFKKPETIGPNTVQNDQIRFAVRKLKARYDAGLARLKNAMVDDARFRRLPRWKGRGELPYHDVLARIQALFSPSHAQELYEHMQALELEVMTRNVETNLPVTETFQQVLSRWENAHGFKPAIDLEPRVYTGKEFRAMMREGALPKDPGLRDPFHLGAGYDRLEFAQHGYDTHRVQWHVVMRDMRLNPEYYTSLGETPLAGELYKFLGSEILMEKLDWTGTGYPGYLTAPNLKSAFPGSRTLWDGLFEGDGYQHDFHSPLFVRKLINDEGVMVWPSLYNVFQ